MSAFLDLCGQGYCVCFSTNMNNFEDANAELSLAKTDDS